MDLLLKVGRLLYAVGKQPSILYPWLIMEKNGPLEEDDDEWIIIRCLKKYNLHIK